MIGPDVVKIAGKRWIIEHIDLCGVTYFGCGILPLRRARSDLMRDIELAQGPEWRGLRFLAILLGLLLCSIGARAQVTAQRSADFLNMLSIQGCLTGGGAPACLNASQQLADMQYLGITHYRTGTDITMSGTSLTALQTLLNNGISLVTGTSYVTPAVVADQINALHAFQAINPNAVYWLDGINEPELVTLSYLGVSGGDGGTWSPIAAFTKDWVTALLADTALKTIPIAGVSRPGAETNDTGLQFATVAGGHSVQANGVVLGQYLNNHIYPTDQQFLQGGVVGACQPNDPTAGNAFALQMHWDNVHTFNGGFSGYASDALAKAVPHVATEFGYPITSPPPSANGDRVTDDKRGRCIMNGLLVGWQFGEKLISIYSMYDTIFGMFTASGTPSASGTMLHNMTTPLADTGPNARSFAPGTLVYTLGGTTASMQSQLFQASNGHYKLLIWDNATNWNMGAGTAVTVGPTNVTVTLGAGVTATFKQFDPTISTTAQQTLNGNSITVPVADYPQIIDIQTPAGASATRAADFINSIAVNTHFVQGISYPNFTTDMAYLGITHFRDGIDGSIGTYTPLFAAGLKLNGIANGLTPGQVTSAADAIVALGTHGLTAIEGPNEINLNPVTYNGNTSNGSTYLPAAQYQAAMYAAVKADSNLAGIQVMDLTSTGAEPNNVGLQYIKIPVGAGTLMADGTVYADWANIHPYAGDLSNPDLAGLFSGELNAQFGHTWAAGFTGYNGAQLLALPKVITETGIITITGGTGSRAVNTAVQAVDILHTLLDAWSAGYTYTTIYEAYDEPRFQPGDEGNYGLFFSASTPKPSATAIHNLTAILGDAGASAKTFMPGSLAYTFTNLPASGKAVAMQQSNGNFNLVVWNEVRNWTNGTPGSPFGVTPVSVTVNLGDVFGTVKVYDPINGTSAISSSNNVSSIVVSLTDHPLIIQAIGAAVVSGSLSTAWNPSDSSAAIALTNQNRTATNSALDQGVRTTTSYTTGKRCFEVKADTITASWQAGLSSQSYALADPAGLGGQANGIAFSPNSGAGQGFFTNGGSLSAGAAPDVSGDKITICADFGAHLFWATSPVMRAATNPWNNSASANPATGTGGFSFSAITCPCFATFAVLFETSGVGTLNATGPFSVVLPAGFLPWQPSGIVLIMLGENDNRSPYANDNAGPVPFEVPVSLR